MPRRRLEVPLERSRRIFDRAGADAGEDQIALVAQTRARATRRRGHATRRRGGRGSGRSRMTRRGGSILVGVVVIVLRVRARRRGELVVGRTPAHVASKHVSLGDAAIRRAGGPAGRRRGLRGRNVEVARSGGATAGRRRVDGGSTGSTGLTASGRGIFVAIFARGARAAPDGYGRGATRGARGGGRKDGSVRASTGAYRSGGVSEPRLAGGHLLERRHGARAEGPPSPLLAGARVRGRGRDRRARSRRAPSARELSRRRPDAPEASCSATRPRRTRARLRCDSTGRR